MALVLQTYDGVSDDEAKQRADYDLRWKVALGVELDARPFAKSTLQEFRAQLIVHEEQAAIFQASLEEAKRRGKFRTKSGEKRKLKVALDTTNILGRGAVKDTYNLLGDGILKLARVLAKLSGQTLTAWAETEGYGRYVGQTSLKGTAEIDWGDASERRRFLAEIVADADRLLEQARMARSGLAAGSAAEASLVEAAGLLSRVLVQDVERREDGPAIKQGVAKDRLLSVHDPEMRHGRKSASKRFDGYKAAVAVDTDEPLITAVAVLAGNAPDAEGAGDRAVVARAAALGRRARPFDASLRAGHVGPHLQAPAERRRHGDLPAAADPAAGPGGSQAQGPCRASGLAAFRLEARIRRGRPGARRLHHGGTGLAASAALYGGICRRGACRPSATIFAGPAARRAGSTPHHRHGFRSSIRRIVVGKITATKHDDVAADARAAPGWWRRRRFALRRSPRR